MVRSQLPLNCSGASVFLGNGMFDCLLFDAGAQETLEIRVFPARLVLFMYGGLIPQEQLEPTTR